MADPRPHGYARAKLDRCPCYTCRWAVAQYYEARERAILYGTWRPFVDASPVRDHIRNLQACGMGLRRIAAEAHVDRKRLQAIITGRPERGTGPQPRVRPETAAAILNVEPRLNLLGPSTPIDGTGTRRRLQALVAAGWPEQELARRLDRTPTNFSSLIRRTHVTVRTALAVRRLYDELWQEDPCQHATGYAVHRARKRAVRLHWAPALAWDDDTLDDPAARPRGVAA
ncbi:hypothetical protein [Streptomyces sioyaensis]|uniref:hypothetical protein n=1 Tax=Streptomyces sioyaensis TaxID=67364 RepID=UPI003D7513ED